MGSQEGIVRVSQTEDSGSSIFSGWIVKGFYFSILVNTLCKVLVIVPFSLFSLHLVVFISLEKTFLFLILFFSFFLSVYNAFSKYLGRSTLDLLVVFCLFFLPLFETYKSIVPLSSFDLFEYMSASWVQLYKESPSLWKVDLVFTFVQVMVLLFVIGNLRNAGIVSSNGIFFRYFPSERKPSLVRGVVRVFCLVWMTLLISLFSAFFFVSAFLGGVSNNTLEIRNGVTLVSTIRTYEKKNSSEKLQKVILVPMVHVGEPGFYKGVVDYVDQELHKWVFLEEGIRDKDKVFGLEIQRGYNTLAKRVHLEEQARNFLNMVKSKYKVVNADVSANQFSEETKKVLNSIFSMMSDSVNLMGFFLQSQKVKVEDEQIKAMGKDILQLRNDRLLSVLETEIKSNPFLVVPWGAAHIPVFQEHLLKSGFVECKEGVVRVMDFSEVVLRYFGLM